MFFLLLVLQLMLPAQQHVLFDLQHVLLAQQQNFPAKVGKKDIRLLIIKKGKKYGV